MPVYDQGYQRFEGERLARPVRSWPITWRALRSTLPQRKYLALLVLAWIPVIIQGFRAYVGRGAGELASGAGGLLNSNVLDISGFFEIGPAFFNDVLGGQGLWALVLLLLTGADLISSDRRHKALQLYFSRPLTFHDYLLGKLAIPGATVLLVTVLPVLLLWFFCLMIQPSMAYLGEVWWVPLATFAWWLLYTVVGGLLLLALSASADRTPVIVVGFLILGGYLSGWIFFLVSELSGRQAWTLLHVQGGIDRIRDGMFGQLGLDGMHPLLHLVALAVVAGASYWQLRRKVRPVEVIQ